MVHLQTYVLRTCLLAESGAQFTALQRRAQAWAHAARIERGTVPYAGQADLPFLSLC